MSEFMCIGEGFSSSDSELKDMYSTYSKKGFVFYVIEAGNTICGCGGLAPLQGEMEGICELRKMYFYDSLRGCGMGGKFLEICIDNARELGYKGIYLETVERMAVANELYAKRGFKILSRPMGNTGHSGCELQYYLNL